MIEFINCNIKNVSVHHVGNKNNEEELLLSKSQLDTSDSRLRELLLKYFLTPFSNDEFYSFTFSNDDLTLNPVCNFSTHIFDNYKLFHKHSIDIAKYLYENSIHHQIKSGDLFVAYFSNISIDDEATDVIGIFKSENRQPFLKLINGNGEFKLHYEDGINIDKLDKGCLIFNTNRDNGFKVCIIDKSNKSIEAQYWKDNFLKIKPCNDNYNHTKEFLNIAKNYVTKQISEEFDVNKTDQIYLLNRSVEYFKTHDTFDKKDFEKEVLQDNNIIKSFRNYNESYRENNEIELSDNFEISSQAVKKQARIFKSVLKLDKNFHIYIHGNKDLIEQGIDKDGRKFYKIYYQEES